MEQTSRCPGGFLSTLMQRQPTLSLHLHAPPDSYSILQPCHPACHPCPTTPHHSPSQRSPTTPGLPLAPLPCVPASLLPHPRFALQEGGPGGALVGIHSALANKLAFQLLERKLLPQLGDYDSIQKEASCGSD